MATSCSRPGRSGGGPGIHRPDDGGGIGYIAFAYDIDRRNGGSARERRDRPRSVARILGPHAQVRRAGLTCDSTPTPRRRSRRDPHRRVRQPSKPGFPHVGARASRVSDRRDRVGAIRGPRAGGRMPLASSRRMTRARWPRYGSRSSSIRASVARRSPARAKADHVRQVEVADAHRVAVAERAKRDFGGGPRPEAGQRGEPPVGVGQRQVDDLLEPRGAGATPGSDPLAGARARAGGRPRMAAVRRVSGAGSRRSPNGPGAGSPQRAMMPR